ncbi:MAG TPA: hypothetical protein VGG62_14375 [Terracidiphilus sp.]
MRVAARLGMLCCFLSCVANLSLGQTAGVAAAGVTKAHPGYAQHVPVKVGSVATASSIHSLTFDAATGALIGGAGKATITSRANAASPSASESNALSNHSNIDGLDTLATFSGAFVAQAGPFASGDFLFSMIGNEPRVGGTTSYPANISEISLQLLNADGSVFANVPFSPFERLTLESPNFNGLNYRSGHNVEYADAIHRAEFYNVMKSNWHTSLDPNVVNKVSIQVPYSVNVQLQDGSIIQARSYFTGKGTDGNTFVLMLNFLFEFFFDNEVVNEINAGNFTTNGINMTLFPNTYLFSLNVAMPNTPGSCCVLGFHTYFLDPTVFPQPRWITEYASWISPGIFGGGFQDVTGLSHETSESFADPFVDNPTPVWQFPGQPANSTECQGNLEDGDPIEVLANATSPIEVKEGRFNFTYHPQNIAMYQWFEMGATSSAIDGAFSFPNETVLTQSAIPCPQ